MNPTRRRFLSAVAAAASLAALEGADSALAAAQGWRTVVRTTRALGTDISITAMHADARVAETAITAAFAELEQVEALMSLYRPQSQLSLLNSAEKLDNPHPYLAAVLRHAQLMSQRTVGAFDVTVQPLWAAYAAAQKAGRLPTADELAAARRHIGWRRIHISDDRITLEPGTAITLNGIAQGFAADRVAAALQRGGVAHALIDTGEIGAMGARGDGEAWTVGIQHPRRPDAYLSVARLAGRHLATSGDYATAFSSDFSHHHLFDPRTGRSADAFASGSILAATGMEADALSTAVFVLGPRRGMELIESTPGADALLALKDGTVYTTPGFPLES